MTNNNFFAFDKEECCEDEQEEVKPTRKPGEAPDGGWGWVIVCGAFVVTLFMAGLPACFIGLLEEMQEDFNVPYLLYAPLVMDAFIFLSGPLASCLIHKFGDKITTFVGGLLVFLGTLVSSQVPHPALIVVFFGAIGGTGLGIAYLPSKVIIAQWFQHKRALATGFAVMGVGVGYLVFNSIVKQLLMSWNWKNIVAIMAAVSLHICASALLYRPLTKLKRKGMKRGVIQHGAIMKALIAEKERQRTISNGSLDNCIITKDNRLIKIDVIDLRNKSNSTINRIKEAFGFSSRSLNKSKNSLIVPRGPQRQLSQLSRSSVRSVLMPKPASPEPPRPLQLQQQQQEQHPDTDSGCGSLENSPKLPNLTEHAENVPSEDPNDPWDKTSPLVVKLPPQQNCGACNVPAAEHNVHALDIASNSPRLNGSMRNSVVSPGSSMRSVNTRVRTISNSSSGKNSVMVPISLLSSATGEQFLDIVEVEEVSKYKLVRILCKTFEFKMLTNVSFCLLIVSCVLTIFGYVIPFYHLPEHGTSLGLTEEKSKYLITIFWVTSMISRPVIGFIADRPVVNPVYFNSFMVTLAGVVSLCSSLFTDYSSLKFYAVLLGLFSASFFTLQSIILMQLYDKDKLVSSLGLLEFFQGIAVCASHVISHVLTSQVALMAMGGVMFVGGLVGFTVPRARAMETRREYSPEMDRLEDIPEEEVVHCESSI
ncbi:uncharacterized protein LOC127867778 [Dreissena polymorpha]|uniref:Monocarboxylate transporter 14 n=1 Tax=Dreissena polymorpha TaxID=45954 RepID=A0A9D4M323_DREPO|nr:uncharacterized protein LOC127867778 [Dreissena polymorpha]KAH3868434.1 hypothetical protein DPMN_031581 [Dreissena polymorpha]